MTYCVDKNFEETGTFIQQGGKGEFPWEEICQCLSESQLCVVFHPEIREISPTMDVCDAHASIFTAVLFSTTKKVIS